MKTKGGQRAKAYVAGAVAGAVATGICMIDHSFFNALCAGIDISLGHSPITRRSQLAGPSLPLIGSIGLEWALAIANVVWARLGIFDGGVGIELEDTFIA